MEVTPPGEQRTRLGGVLFEADSCSSKPLMEERSTERLLLGRSGVPTLSFESVEALRMVVMNLDDAGSSSPKMMELLPPGGALATLLAGRTAISTER